MTKMAVIQSSLPAARPQRIKAAASAARLFSGRRAVVSTRREGRARKARGTRPRGGGPETAAAAERPVGLCGVSRRRGIPGKGPEGDALFDAAIESPPGTERPMIKKHVAGGMINIAVAPRL